MEFQYRTEFVRVIDGPKGDRVEVLGCQDGRVSVEAGSPIGPAFVMPWQQALCVGQAIIDTAREKQREAESRASGEIAAQLLAPGSDRGLAATGVADFTAALQATSSPAHLCKHTSAALMEAENELAQARTDLDAWRAWARKHVGDAGRTDGEQRSIIEMRFASRFAPGRSVGEVLGADAPVAELSLIDLLRSTADQHQKSRPGLAEAARDLADRLSALEPEKHAIAVHKWTVTVFRGMTKIDAVLLPPAPDGVLKIGKHARSNIRLDDERVGQFHAVIQYGPLGAPEIVDCGACDTTVSGAPVNKSRQLLAGDTIGIGPFRLVVTSTEGT